MSLLNSPWEQPPLFTNAEGVKWWLDEDSTKWARREDNYGTVLPTIVVFYVEEPNGHRTRVITDQSTNPPEQVYASPRMEDIAVHIDMMKVALRYPAEKDKGSQ